MPPAGVIAVVSPHLDDAVLSCGQMLAAHRGSRVVTVFSGGPARVWRLPAWDRSSGIFSPGDNVMRVRRGEDDDALAVLGALPERLGLWDSQYRDRPRWTSRVVRRPAPRGPADDVIVDAVADRLHELVASLGPATWLMPLGLVHRDHRLTAEACRRVARRMPGSEWVAYVELPYGVESPELVADCLAQLVEEGWRSEEVMLPTDPDQSRKLAAVQCYRSQAAALGVRRELALAGRESYLRLRPPPGGTPR